MRNGYQKKFLSQYSIELPTPSLSLLGDVLQPPGLADGEVVVPYIHYSLLMSKSTKQALYSAANVDNSAQQIVSGRKGRKWFIDERVGRENQVTNDAYRKSPWDRGHLTRRTAITWGDCNTALAASNDSCAYTNASMQHKEFNEDEWRLPEKAIANFQLAKDDKLIVMTGPVFTTCDRFFTKSLGFDPVRIPSGFWKTVTYINHDEQLVTAAYIFFQDMDALSLDDAKNRMVLKNARITTTELQLWTGLAFDQQMFDSNPLKFYSGPESLKLANFKELSDVTKGLLAAGIVEGSAYEEAKYTLALDALYELIDDISWY